MTDRIAILEETLTALEQAAERLRTTRHRVAALFPLSETGFEALDEESRERLDAFSVRYARCQDSLYPTMRALGRAIREPKAEGSFLELFALMQKQGIVKEIGDWDRQRGLRNAISHEYPETAKIIEILNGVYEAAHELFQYVAEFRRQALTLQV